MTSAGTKNSLLHELRRGSANNSPRLDIFGDDSASGDNGTFAYCHAW